jgi:hypothetical protein
MRSECGAEMADGFLASLAEVVEGLAVVHALLRGAIGLRSGSRPEIKLSHKWIILVAILRYPVDLYT